MNELVLAEPGVLATLQDLEEASYQLVAEMGEAEWKLVVVLSAIRDSGQWQAGHERFDQYLYDWSIEASHRMPRGRGLPVSIRVLQTKLALHRRLVEWAGLDAQEVLGQPYYIMDKLCRTLGRWDYKTGEPTLNDASRLKLAERYGEADDVELVRAAAQDVAHIAIPGEAIQFIQETFGPPVQDRATYEFVLETRAGIPSIRCHVQERAESGEVVEDYWCSSDYPWPEDAISYLAKLIGATPVDRT